MIAFGGRDDDGRDVTKPLGFDANGNPLSVYNCRHPSGVDELISPRPREAPPLAAVVLEGPVALPVQAQVADFEQSLARPPRPFPGRVVCAGDTPGAVRATCRAEVNCAPAGELGDGHDRVLERALVRRVSSRGTASRARAYFPRESGCGLSSSRLTPPRNGLNSPVPLRESAPARELGIDLGRTRLHLEGKPGAKLEAVTSAWGAREWQPEARTPCQL
jgi:hypothetical protein